MIRATAYLRRLPMEPTVSTATLSKKERKQLRKQMLERKQQLQAKHGRAASSGSREMSGKSVSFSDIQPKLPSDRPRSALPAWTPPRQPEPKRELAPTGQRGSVFTDRDPVPANDDATPRVVELHHPHPETDRSGVAAGSTRYIGIDVPPAGPGPLTRLAAGVEQGVRGLLHRWQRYRDHRGEAPRGEPLPRRADMHRQLAWMVGPLRVLAWVMVAGAVALGRESRGIGVGVTGSLVVLGAGLALAIGLLTLAQLVQGMRVLLRQR